MVERSSLFRPKDKLRPKKFCKIEGFPGIFGFSIKTGFRTEDEKNVSAQISLAPRHLTRTAFWHVGTNAMILFLVV
jgi:hypothetical protein